MRIRRVQAAHAGGAFTARAAFPLFPYLSLGMHACRQAGAARRAPKIERSGGHHEGVDCRKHKAQQQDKGVVRREGAQGLLLPRVQGPARGDGGGAVPGGVGVRGVLGVSWVHSLTAAAQFAAQRAATALAHTVPNVHGE